MRFTPLIEDSNDADHEERFAEGRGEDSFEGRGTAALVLVEQRFCLAQLQDLAQLVRDVVVAAAVELERLTANQKTCYIATRAMANLIHKAPTIINYDSKSCA